MNPQSYENLLRVKRESLTLLKERGYVIPSEEASILNGTIRQREFVDMYNSIQKNPSGPLFPYFENRPMRVAMSNIYNRGKEQCLVYFADPSGRMKNPQISEQEISNFCMIISKFKVDEAIVIAGDKPSNVINDLTTDVMERNKCTTRGVFIQYFMDDELFYNPIDHVLVPHHRIMKGREVEEMIKIDKIMPSKLPQISIFDPVCKRLGARPNDVIEITRKILAYDCLIDEEISYRNVIVPHAAKKKK